MHEPISGRQVAGAEFAAAHRGRVLVDRSDIAVHDAAGFAALAEKAKGALAA